jgi:uncharacterized protein involved in exopolysaccharide biosynthesis
VSMIVEVARELLGMFLADARLTTATVFLVGLVSIIVWAVPAEPLWAGAVLILGCLAILVGAVLREAMVRNSSG